MQTEKIYSDFSAALKKFILSKVKNETIADDILQEVFIKIHLHKNELQQKDKLKSWLFQIANNTILDYFRKRELVLPDSDKNIRLENPEKDHHDATDCLVPLILKLPKKYKDILILTEVKGFKQKYAADQLNISLPAAKSRIQRGRELLKQGFMDCCDYKLDENGFLKGAHKNKEDCKVCNS
ncbi:RNA polymerase sigma factor SigZ [Flavicella marina]|uniref:RNA polymerase sigma factor SigZ n=1 Tax=Flavicella marina TaxID=1475951 RepID=UPI0012644280|nr:RNA polymerase sigma factor SigZ [Flavicella marina]